MTPKEYFKWIFAFYVVFTIMFFMIILQPPIKYKAEASFNIKFDLSQIPEDAVIESMELYLYFYELEVGFCYYNLNDGWRLVCPEPHRPYLNITYEVGEE